MLTRMQPDTGGRFSLRLGDLDLERARYELQLVTRDGEWSTDVQVSSADGPIECAVWRGEGEPPAWLFHYARAALRSAWHSHREQGWPRRLTRWRDVPVRGESGASRGD